MMTGQEQQTQLSASTHRKAMRGLMVLVLSGLSGWGFYSLTIEMGMQPRAIWFVVATIYVFLWLVGVSDKIADAEYEAINARYQAESLEASLERLREKLYSGIDITRNM